MWWRRRCGPGGGDRCAALIALPAVSCGFQGNSSFFVQFRRWGLRLLSGVLPWGTLGALTGLGDETMPCRQFAAVFQ